MDWVRNLGPLNALKRYKCLYTGNTIAGNSKCFFFTDSLNNILYVVTTKITGFMLKKCHLNYINLTN